MSTSKSKYKEIIRSLSDQIVLAQKPIRILDAIKWEPQEYERFRASGFKQMPAIDAAYYQKIPLRYDPLKKEEEFKNIKTTIQKELGPSDSIGVLLCEIVDQYIKVMEMVNARGTHDFWKWSKELYGSPDDFLLDGSTRISSMGQLLYEIFSRSYENMLGPIYPKTLTAVEVVKMLTDSLGPYFSQDAIRVEVSDGIVADASAGGDVIKINESVKFSKREVRMLEVHNNEWSLSDHGFLACGGASSGGGCSRGARGFDGNYDFLFLPEPCTAN